MPCFHPLQGYRARHVNPASGKRSIVFSPQAGYFDLPVTVNCGRCIGCRLERSRQWAMRCVHEASMHADNAFITLTYNDQHLPPGGTLIKKHFQDFMKRLRRRFGHVCKYVNGKRVSTIRYYHCGEYGERSKRPHYHALLFGIDFPDKKLHSRKLEIPLFTSDTLSQLWGMGFCTIGAVTFESAAYTARYIIKKITGDAAESHYRVVAQETGEITQRLPEYTTMSLKPTVGRGWFEEFASDVYPDDFVVLRGQRMKPPKYYDRLHETDAPLGHVAIKAERARYGRAHQADSTPERLAVRKKCKEAQILQLKRELE